MNPLLDSGEYETALEQQVAENEALYTKAADLQTQLQRLQVDTP